MTVNISKHQGSPLRLITKNFPYKLKLALDTI